MNPEGHEALRARYAAADQGHVFRFLDSLPPADARALLAQAEALDLGAVAARHAAAEAGAAHTTRIEPPADELVRLGNSDEDSRRRLEARDRGLAELDAGRVAVVVAAGGQGTRLGSAAPKAMWPAGPTTGKPLIQWLGEKVRFWTARVGRRIPFVIMVSDATEKATLDFLRWHRYFGLDPTWVRLVKQGEHPCLDTAGRLLLATPGRIATAPNGHGGLYGALAESRVLQLLDDHGIRSLSYVQVDNPLIQPVDPLFLGLHALAGSQISSKSVAKRHAGERVGVFARVDGHPAVVEYSELTDDQAHAVDGDDRLLYGQGSIAAHVIDVDFARTMADAGLPIHRALKRVPHVDSSGEIVQPSDPNGWKFESFLFDAIPLAERSLVVETRREAEFSPIKNATGDDSPATARRDLNALFRGWHERAGLAVTDGNVEVDPSRAPNEEAFREIHGIAEDT